MAKMMISNTIRKIFICMEVTPFALNCTLRAFGKNQRLSTLGSRWYRLALSLGKTTAYVVDSAMLTTTC